MKARSIGVPDTATEGGKPLPGEHGFRFFPSFYRHVFDTMRRIPDGDDGGSGRSSMLVAGRAGSNRCVQSGGHRGAEQRGSEPLVAVLLSVSIATDPCFHRRLEK